MVTKEIEARQRAEFSEQLRNKTAKELKQEAAYITNTILAAFPLSYAKVAGNNWQLNAINKELKKRK